MCMYDEVKNSFIINLTTIPFQRQKKRVYQNVHILFSYFRNVPKLFPAVINSTRNNRYVILGYLHWESIRIITSIQVFKYRKFVVVCCGNKINFGRRSNLKVTTKVRQQKKWWCLFWQLFVSLAIGIGTPYELVMPAPIPISRLLRHL